MHPPAACVDESFRYELLAEEDWIGRRLVVDKLQEGRIFICGDAAHLWCHTPDLE